MEIGTLECNELYDDIKMNHIKLKLLYSDDKHTILGDFDENENLLGISVRYKGDETSRQFNFSIIDGTICTFKNQLKDISSIFIGERR